MIIWYLLFSIAIISFDRITKLWAVQYCLYPFIMSPNFSFHVVYNRGFAFSLAATHNDILFHLVSLTVVICTLIIITHAYNLYQKGLMIWAETAIIAGSLSNIYDRYTVGGVIDFVEISYGTTAFPSFNIADIAIVLGIVCMVVQEYGRNCE